MVTITRKTPDRGSLISSGRVAIGCFSAIWMTLRGSNDSCATLAIMNVLLNCEEVELGSLLEEFKEFTNDFDPVVRSALYPNYRHQPPCADAGIGDRPVIKIAQSTQLYGTVRFPFPFFGPNRGSAMSKSYFCRPADLRASLSSVATATLKAAKQNKPAPKATAVKRKRKSLSLPKPKAKGDGKQKGKKTNDEDNISEGYHSIAY